MTSDNAADWHVVVGFGSAGARHVAILRELGVERIAVVRTHSGPTVRTTPDGVLELSDLRQATELEPAAAVVATPTAMHVQQARILLEHGIPTLVEKPLAASVADAVGLLDLARERGVPLVVGYHLRFHPVVTWLGDLIRSGQLGRALLLRASWGEFLPDWHPGEDFRVGYAARSDQGGGPIPTLSHAIDYAITLLGPAVRVVGSSATVSDLGISVPDLACIHMVHGSRAVSEIELDYVTRPPKHTVEVRFERGRVSWDVLADELRVDSIDRVQGAPDVGAASRQQCFVAQMRAFLGQARDNVQSNLDHELAVADAIEAALATSHV